MKHVVWRLTYEESIMMGENRVWDAAKQLAEAAEDKCSRAPEVGGKPGDSVPQHSIGPGEVQQAQYAADIREHMPVIASCGNRVGTVEAVEDDSIKVTKDAGAAPGKPRYIPTDWVNGVEDCVQLNKNSKQVEEGATVKPGGAGDEPAAK
jgi:hypothetical protein